MRVFVVEDDPGITAAIEQVLALDDHEVTVVPDGRTALSRLLEPPLPDVILLDLALPGMNGRELLEHLARHRPAMVLPPVVLMTATLREDRLPDPGTYRILLRKPFDVADILAVVRAAAPGTSE